MGCWLARLRILGALLLLALSGCGHKPEQMRDKAVRAEQQAKQAFEQHQAETAAQAAETAEDVFHELEVEAKDNPATGIQSFLNETRLAATSARLYAQLADEERQCRERLGSLKLTVYRQMRAWACNYGLAGPAAAAEHFGLSNTLSSIEQPLADLAWNLVASLEHRRRLTNGTPDWAGVAVQLRRWQTNPPPSLGLVLAPAFAIHGLTDFALCEVEAIEPSGLTATNTLAVYHLERSVLFAVHGWDKTAGRELQQAVESAPEGVSKLVSTQAWAIVRVWQAANCLRNGDLAGMDREIEKALEAWPDNPLLPFLQSERLLAAGQWEQAAAVLEQAAKRTTDSWVSRKMTDRAHELRQSAGKAPPLFSDARFMLDFVLHTAGGWVSTVGGSDKFERLLEAAKAFGERVASQLPGGGS